MLYRVINIKLNKSLKLIGINLLLKSNRNTILIIFHTICINNLFHGYSLVYKYRLIKNQQFDFVGI